MNPWPHAADCAALPESVDRYDTDIEGWVEQRIPSTAACNCAVAEIERLTDLLAARIEDIAKMQKHRDEWREYAYGNRDRPKDFIDGNKIAAPTTEQERLRGIIEDEAKWLDINHKMRAKALRDRLEDKNG